LHSSEGYLQNLGALSGAEIFHIRGNGFHIFLNFINSFEDLENKNQIQGNLSGNLESGVGKFLLIHSDLEIALNLSKSGKALYLTVVNRVKLRM
jgi:hypothetical protein